ncbi:MAG: amidohydrolase, partial [bacterium]
MIPSRQIDLVIVNARLYDPIEGALPQTALAISNSRIYATGSNREIKAIREPDTNWIDARGYWLLPAFTDSHTHFLGYVRRQSEVSLESCRSLPEALQVLKDKVEKTPPGEWICGGGWNHNQWPDSERPTRHHLDEISEQHFIALDSKDWHTCWVNTPVLKLADISLEKPYPGATQLALHPKTGKFTGILEENARLTVLNLIPKWDYPRLRKVYLQTVQNFHRLGFSGIHSVETLDEYRLYQEARHRNELNLRIFWYMPHDLLPDAEKFVSDQDPDDDYLRIAGVKIFVDGAFGSQTAELLENYDGLSHAGVEALDEESLDRIVTRSIAARLSCAVHAIGDRAIRKTLRIFGRNLNASQQNNLRHRIEHAQLIQPDDLPLFSRYRIYPSVQPLHLAYDIPVIRKYLSKRAQFTYPFASLQKNGAKLIFGSDIPIEDFNPWHAIYTAMERRHRLEPEQEIFYPEEKLDLFTCLQAYTVNAAEAVGMERIYGQIKPGQRADFFLADRDIFEVEAENLKDTR